jgi:uncharacterized protein YndB with AHSA1/START domain
MTATSTTTDRIEKQVLLRAPRAEVWHALIDTRRFGEWFGAALPEGTFAPGARVAGQITHPGYEHLTFAVTVERVEPERLLAWRWHPDVDAPEAEPTTLVEFTLQDVTDGTLLKVVESGFDHILADRRDRVYRGNEEGWTAQMEAIARYVGERA